MAHARRRRRYGEQLPVYGRAGRTPPRHSLASPHLSSFSFPESAKGKGGGYNQVYLSTVHECSLT